MTLAAISYGAGTVCWLLLLLLLLLGGRQSRPQARLLPFAVFATLVWVATSVFLVHSGQWWGTSLYVLLEVARPVVWLVFLAHLLKPLLSAEPAAPRLLRLFYPTVAVLSVLPLAAVWFPGVPSSRDLAFFGHVGLAIMGLALIEQLFRNTRPERRWATKYLYLGVGVLFVYHLFLYSDALLFSRLDPDIWAACGFVSSLATPFIAVAAARNPEWSGEVFVSRRLVFHSVSIAGAGIYLLLMAAAGYYIRFYGGTWGTAVQLTFLAGAGVLLLTLLFSGQVRAALMLFLSRNFFHYKYDYREEWIRFIDTLSTTAERPDEPLRERAVRALAEIVHCPSGMLWTRGDDGCWHPAATWNWGRHGPYSEPADLPLAEFLQRRQWVIELDRLVDEPELYAGVVLPDWLRDLPQAWSVVPLLLGNTLRGFIVLARPRSPHALTWEDRDLLQTAGRQVASYIALLDTTDALVDARQFEAFNRLSAYVVHDLKNIVAQLSLIVANAERHKHNPEFVDDMLSTVENATVRMNRMLTQLRKGTAPAGGEARLFDLENALRDVVGLLAAQRPVPCLNVIDRDLSVCINRERFLTVMQHLVQNAQEAAGPDGRVELQLARTDDSAVIAVIDDGCGMDARFIQECLFRPFHTTKGNAGMGIGAYESREFIVACGGRIDVRSQPGAGTTFLVHLPLAGAAATASPPVRTLEMAS
jgi:putative PEP-CTERM system histidine kinase